MRLVQAFVAAAVLAVALVAAPALAGEAIIGGGVAYGSDIGMPGLQFGAYYRLDGKLDHLRLGGDVDGFLPNHDDVPGGKLTSTLFDVNVNAQYLFFRSPEAPLTFYGLTGLSLAFVGAKVDNTTTRDVSDHAVKPGLNLGAGAEFDISFAAAYLEAKYVVSDANQLVAVLGLRFGLGG